METILKRVLQVQEYSELSNHAFAKRIGMAPATIDMQIRGERSISITTVTNIVLTFEEVNADWLLTGRGIMFKQTTDSTISIGMNKVGNGSAVAIGNGASSSISDSEILKENARLREENKQLRERCDKLTDKLLGI